MDFGLSNIVGSSIQAIGNIVATNLANTKQKRRDTDAFNRQLQLLDYQNAYNTPAAQMERYKEAGLNPNLIYGQSNLSAGVSGVSTGSRVQSPDLSPIGQGLSRALQDRLADISERKVANEEAKTDIENERLTLEQNKLHYLNQYRDAVLGRDEKGTTLAERKYLLQKYLTAARLVEMGQSVVNMGTQGEIMQHNLGFAREFGLPVGDKGTPVVGDLRAAIYGLGTWLDRFK